MKNTRRYVPQYSVSVNQDRYENLRREYARRLNAYRQQIERYQEQLRKMKEKYEK